MKIKNIWLNLADGTKQYHLIKADIRKVEEANAVYAKGFSQNNLDADLGVGIEIELDNVESWIADFRHSEYWCMPAFGNKLKDIPDETQGFIYKKNNGFFGVILPVVSDKYKCVLCGNENNTISAKIFSWYSELNYCDTLAFLQAEGENPYVLLEKLVTVGLKLLNNGCRIRKDRRYPEIFEYLGWCSWDAMEIRVNEKDLLKKCNEFKEKKIPVKWVIIDDMWAEVHDFYGMEYKGRTEMFRLMHSSKLSSFNADPIRFPNGLKKCIERINEFGIKVGIWHPTTGYWMGIDPEGEIYEKYKSLLIKTNDGRYIHDFSQEKAYMFYNAFHDCLKKDGAEFVKIDNQSMTRRFYKLLAPVGKISRNFHNAMEASVGQHFDNAMINCMGMASEDMWNRPVSPISRCSDDFLPEDSEWFTKHIMQCAYNDLIQGQFYYCDWDMWWTDDGQAIKNSILRAVSGGPIYISDELERSKRDIIMPLITNDGKILRCDRPAMPTIDCLTIDPTKSLNIFKLQNICGNSGVVAVFNINALNEAVKGTVSPSDVEGLKGDEFVAYEHFSKKVAFLNKNEKIDVVLKDKNEFKLYIIVPLKNGFAPIGRTDKFISPKTIKRVYKNKIELTEPGEYAYVENRKLFFEDMQER